MQLCKDPSSVGIFATRRRATSFGSENASLDQKNGNVRLNNLDNTPTISRSTRFCDTLEAQNMANFLFLLAPKILLIRKVSLFSVHSTFRFVFSRAELFTVQTRLTQAFAEENKQTCLYESYPLDREKA